MSAAAFPSPAAEMAEMNRLQYELDYTEGISQRMRIPEMLKVAPHAREDHATAAAASIMVSQDVHHSVIMQVPERIVVAGDGNDLQFPRPRDLDLIQSTPLEALSLKTPPRVLTLNERPLDFLEEEQQQQQQQRGALTTDEVLRPQVRLRRERSASENAAARHGAQLAHSDSTLALATYEPTLDGGPDDMTVVDATTLRRQLIKLNRRLQHLEEESKERARREMIMYSVTVAFWLVNTWVWLRR
ncbi:mitochondrial fission factor homolog B isoform X4 [Nelusetta ayraudi]|uniref:mitochondrial fission factor homolog B isoform X4 n=1 Tax=Nelusetta ayraudi TaxID=303726 RepID=UPI003F72C1A6